MQHGISVLAARMQSILKTQYRHKSHITEESNCRVQLSHNTTGWAVYTGLANSGRHSRSYWTQGEIQHQLILSAVYSLSKAKPTFKSSWCWDQASFFATAVISPSKHPELHGHITLAHLLSCSHSRTLLISHTCIFSSVVSFIESKTGHVLILMVWSV